VEWLFSTDQGRVQLAQSAGYQRLIVVALHRDQKYDDLDAIQAELSSKVMELAPPNLGNVKVIYILRSSISHILFSVKSSQK
jgi:hypothetical protein